MNQINIPMQAQGGDGLSSQYYVGNLTTRAYADAGALSLYSLPADVVGVFATPAGSGDTLCSFSLGGYLVAMP